MLWQASCVFITCSLKAGGPAPSGADQSKGSRSSAEKHENKREQRRECASGLFAN